MFDWERNWRGSGVFFTVAFIIGWVIYGSRPKVGSSGAELVSFYDGDRTRILVGAALLAFNVLNLLWFAAALASVLRDAGKGGWGVAATIASAATGTILFLGYTLSLALAYSIAGSGNDQLTSGLNDLSWILGLVASFPVAMLIMSGSFGLWRAGIISNASFAAGVTAMVVLLLGATAWAGGGFWAPDGAYLHYVSPVVALAWVAAVSSFLMRLPTSAVAAPGRAAVPAT
jgi:hypothetical protein